jgi:hypothetical protein
MDQMVDRIMDQMVDQIIIIIIMIREGGQLMNQLILIMPQNNYHILLLKIMNIKVMIK